MHKQIALAVCLAAAMHTPARAIEFGHFALAVFTEDVYFDVTHLTLKDAENVVLRDMPEDACVYASKFLNAHGAFTACIRLEN